MEERRSLVAEVRAKCRLSNAFTCLKVLLDLVPVVVVVQLACLHLAGDLTHQAILWGTAAMAAGIGGKAVCSYLATWQAHRTAYSCLTDLRLRIVGHLKQLPLGFFQERKTGDLANIVQNDVEQVEGYLAHGLPESASATVLPAAVFLAMLVIDWRLALAMAAGLPLMWLVRRLAAPLWARGFATVARSTTAMQERIMEYVANIPVIKAFGRDEGKTEEAIAASRDYVRWVTKSMNGISVPMGLIALFMESGVVLVMILGTWLFATGGIDIQRLVLAMVLAGAFTASVAKTATLQHYRIVFNRAMDGIGSILDVPIRHVPPVPDPQPGDIVFDGVSFSYPAPVASPQPAAAPAARGRALDGVSLVFRQGSTNALIGASGCGKSTLAALLMGFWQPGGGSVSIGGTDLSTLSGRQVASLVSIVQQDVFLFDQSIEDNIRIGRPDATHGEVVAAARRARIHDFIVGLPQGYATLAGEGGARLSGGERQRISIARMMLKDAPIVILDEATAAVDAENEALIQAAIDDLARGKTVIVIAHHLDTVRAADQIVVMESGRVAGSGTHGELMETCPLYAQMVADQARSDNWDIKEG